MVHSRDSPAELPRNPGPVVRVRTLHEIVTTYLDLRQGSFPELQRHLPYFREGNIADNLRLLQYYTTSTAYGLRVGKIDGQRATVGASHRERRATGAE